MSIKEIHQSLKDLSTAGTINLHDIATLAQPFSILLKHFPPLEDTVLSNLDLKFSANPAQLTVKANIPLAGDHKLTMELSITRPRTSLSAQCSLTYPNNVPLNIPSLNWFTLGNISISMKSFASPRDDGRELSSTLSCVMTFGDHKLPLESAYYTGEGLTLTAKPENFTLGSFQEIAVIAGGSQRLSFPPELDALGQLKLDTVSVQTSALANNNMRLQAIDFQVTLQEMWQLVPSYFALGNIVVKPQISQPLSSARTVTGNISGKMKIADTAFTMQAERTDANAQWQFNGELPSINFADLIGGMLQELRLPNNLPDISFSDTRLTITPSSGDFSLTSQSASANHWQIDLGGKQIRLEQLKLDVQRQASQLSANIDGSSQLFDTQINAGIALSATPKFTAKVKNINFLDIAETLLDQLQIPVDIPDFSFATIHLSAAPMTQEFVLKAESLNDWHIPLGVTGLDIEDVSCQLSRKHEANRHHQENGKIAGTVSIAGVQFELSVSFPGEFVFTATVPVLGLSHIIQDLCGPEALMGFQAPTGFLNLTLNNLSISANPNAKSITLQGESLLGKLQLLIQQSAQGQWQFATAMSPPENWRFSALDSSLSSLDGLGFGGTMLLASNAPGSALPTDFFNLPPGTRIGAGLSLIARLDTSDLGLDDLMDLDSLSVSATIGTSPADMVITAGIDGTFPISNNVSMGNMGFMLQPAPSNFALGIKGEVLARIDNSDLVFIGTMKVRPLERSAAFAATMLGEWREPFGVKGFAVSDLAIDIGIGIVPPPATVAPIVGLAGSVQIGSFIGSAAVKADTVTPSKSMISASFNELFLQDILSTFCDPVVMNRIPAELRDTVLQVGMEDVGVHVVPQPTQIGELHFEPGFAFQGKLFIADFDAEFEFKLDYSKGIRIRATMDPINIEDVVIIRGSGTHPGPLLDINLMLGNDPGVTIAAFVQILGVSVETFISLSDQGFTFMVTGNLFDRFEAQIEASGGNLKEGGDFFLKVTMRNDLMAYLREQATNAIEQGVNEATRSLSNAQEDVRDAQRSVDSLQRQIDDMRRRIQRERNRDIQNIRNAENAVANERRKVNRLQNDINRMRRTIKAERDRDSAAIRSAENKVSSEQAKVRRLQRQIEDMRRTIRHERERDTAKIRNARRDVTSAQRSVDNLRGEIRNTKSHINRLKADIRRKKRWLDDSPWWRKADRGIEYAAYAAAKNTEIVANYTQIGGIEAAILTARGALEVAKQVLRGIEQGARTFPIDADPRIIGLFTAKETANAALEIAKQALRLARRTIQNFPIDADPRIIGLFTAKETANAALLIAERTLDTLQDAARLVPIDADPRVIGLFAAKETATAGLTVAEGVLEGIKITVGGLGDAATFIVEVGLGGLFDVKKAGFAAQLNAVKGGSVQLALSVELMGQPHDVALAFNFHEPLSGAKSLGEQMLRVLT